MTPSHTTKGRYPGAPSASHSRRSGEPKRSTAMAKTSSDGMAGASGSEGRFMDGQDSSGVPTR